MMYFRQVYWLPPFKFTQCSFLLFDMKIWSSDGMTVFPVVLSEHYLLYCPAAGLILRPALFTVTREHTIGLTTNLIRAVTPNHNTKVIYCIWKMQKCLVELRENKKSGLIWKSLFTLCSEKKKDFLVDFCRVTISFAMIFSYLWREYKNYNDVNFADASFVGRTTPLTVLTMLWTYINSATNYITWWVMPLHKQDKLGWMKNVWFPWGMRELFAS